MRSSGKEFTIEVLHFVSELKAAVTLLPVRLGVPKFICSEPTILAMSREVVMLTRRGFSGFAACATCGIGEFVAAEVSAQGTQPAATPGVTRKILSQMHGPAPGYVN
jgi:hypothetical protein